MDKPSVLPGVGKPLDLLCSDKVTPIQGYTEAQLLSAYSKGAKGMRNRAIAMCNEKMKGASNVAWPIWLDCQAALRNLPLTSEGA